MAWKEYECHSSVEHNESNDQRPVRMHGIRSRSCRVEMSAAHSHKWNVGERNDCNSAEREQRKQTAELSACGCSHVRLPNETAVRWSAEDV